MSEGKKLHQKMRVYHRYLGFFLAGIMAMYALSGILLIFRDTDFLKVEKTIVKSIAPGIKNEELGQKIGLRKLKVDSEKDSVVYFKEGTYNKMTGIATYTQKELPAALNALTALHKSRTEEPLFLLNIFFGASLFFFVLSAFWMYMPGTTIFKKGMWFALAGMVLVIAMLLFEYFEAVGGD